MRVKLLDQGLLNNLPFGLKKAVLLSSFIKVFSVFSFLRTLKLSQQNLSQGLFVAGNRYPFYTSL